MSSYNIGTYSSHMTHAVNEVKAANCAHKTMMDAAILVILPCYLIKSRFLSTIYCLQGFSQMHGNVYNNLHETVEFAVWEWTPSATASGKVLSSLIICFPCFSPHAFFRPPPQKKDSHEVGASSKVIGTSVLERDFELQIFTAAVSTTVTLLF